MPLYEYHCLDCRTEFDLLRTIQNADAAARCPACEGSRTRRGLSLVAARPAGGDSSRENGMSGGCGCGGTCACGGR